MCVRRNFSRVTKYFREAEFEIHGTGTNVDTEQKNINAKSVNILSFKF